MSTMNGGRVQIPMIEPTDEGTHIEVSVFHQKAGMNYLTSNREGGGIYVAVSPITIKSDGIVSRVLFKGAKARIEDTDRLNRKKLAAAFNRVKADLAAKTGIVQKLIDDQGFKVIDVEAVPTGA